VSHSLRSWLPFAELAPMSGDEYDRELQLALQRSLEPPAGGPGVGPLPPAGGPPAAPPPPALRAPPPSRAAPAP